MIAKESYNIPNVEINDLVQVYEKVSSIYTYVYIIDFLPYPRPLTKNFSVMYSLQFEFSNAR